MSAFHNENIISFININLNTIHVIKKLIFQF